jgi:hypothetical protein
MPSLHAKGGGGMISLVAAAAESIENVGPNAILSALKTELFVLRARLAGLRDGEQHLIDLVRLLEASI